VLREVFDVACDQIAEAVGKSPAAVRQIAHRARAHVAARRPRGPVSPAQTRDALEAFQRAAKQAICNSCSTSSRRTASSRGPAAESCRPRWRLSSGLGRIAAAASLQPALVNGYPALIVRLNSEIDTVIVVRVDDGLIGHGLREGCQGFTGPIPPPPLDGRYPLACRTAH